MNTIFIYRNGTTEQTTRIDRAWFNPASGAILWVDLEAPSIPESLLLSDSFAFHPLAVEDALSRRERPKLEAYDGYLFIVLADARFFVGPHFLVTVSGGAVRALDETRDNVAHDSKRLGEGSVALCHRIMDELVDGYAPAVAEMTERIDAIAERVVERPAPAAVREVFALQTDVLAWRRRVAAEADVVARLARREFIDVSTEMAFRFRDVHDHLLAAADDLEVAAERIVALMSAASTLAAGARRWI